MHYQATKSRPSEEACIHHIAASLKQFQREIETFGAHNADAVVTASIFLAGTAQH